ncbi:diacylglycerol kinase family lipid kinase [soil metagenome]
MGPPDLAARPRRVTVLHNPTSGDASPDAESLLPMLEEAGYETRYQSTKDAWEGALQWPADLVAVVGGDGTVGKVARELAGRELPFTILPTGKANNVAKTLGISGDAQAVARSWASAGARNRPFDIWDIGSHRGRARSIEAVGGGFIAATMARSSELRPPTLVLGGTLDRALHLVREALSDETEAHWDIQVDGRDLSGSYIGVEAMNIRAVGPNLRLLPAADPGDGLIDVVLVRAQDRARLQDWLISLEQARARDVPELSVERGRDVRLLPPVSAAVHIDDESWAPGTSKDESGETSIHIRLAGQARVLIGADAGS